MISQNIKTEIDNVLTKYPDKRAALIPFLHIIQEKEGWISEQSIVEIADFLELSHIDVKETVSFYTMFNMEPVGKYHFQVCSNISCSLLNSRHIVLLLEEKLKIKSGCTRDDLKCSLSEVECLGYCGDAPVMMVNDVLYEKLTPDKINQLLAEFKLS